MRGRLKHSLPRKCPACKKPLQLRVVDVVTLRKGENITKPEEFISCSNPHCLYEEAVEQKRKREKTE